jgi:hypothetical protein
MTLERIRGKGMNDKIQAPEDGVEGEEGEGGGTTTAHDDVTTADVLATWAASHVAELEQELAHGGDLSSYEIPSGLFGPSSLSSMVPAQGGGGAVPPQGRNPLAQMTAVSHNGTKADPMPTTRAGDLSQWLSSVLSTSKK